MPSDKIVEQLNSPASQQKKQTKKKTSSYPNQTLFI